MADAVTTFLNLTNPEVGASSDSWGAKENTDRSTVDAMLSTLLTGLTLSTAGGSGTFGIAIGAASGMVLASAYTKTTSAWAVGTGNGGIDTGAIANSTWYHVYLIQRVDTSVVDVLFSLSATSPTMPASYTRKRRIGSMLTDGSAHWLKFIQKGDEFLWAYATVTTVSTSLVLDTPSSVVQQVPTGLQVIARIRGRFQTANGLDTFYSVTSPDEVDTCITNSANSTGRLISNTEEGFTADVRTDTTAKVVLAATGSGTFPILVSCAYGWIDARGKA